MTSTNLDNVGICVKLGLKKCYFCERIIGGDCWVYFFKKELIRRHNKVEIKSFLINSIKNLKNHPPHIDYLLAAISSVCPEYLSFIDKIFILI